MRILNIRGLQIKITEAEEEFDILMEYNPNIGESILCNVCPYSRVSPETGVKIGCVDFFWDGIRLTEKYDSRNKLFQSTCSKLMFSVDIGMPSKLRLEDARGEARLKLAMKVLRGRTDATLPYPSGSDGVFWDIRS